ncbi:looped-hinge helix DNA binding domain, AbrB family [Natrinema pellirubrum DSM 15624]|uniref:Looped-hinge helix DNA binding domain, AbrB family n=1 Tax=Natrinema pellirubrum (strain DSM 15624 / CIP 106293 / JCM 10476 / NCIMB 786 / 157) TaxID=797303 RepID=L0JGQ4_NATP1|nr:AbrB/MazE/SpoVT family DNA-binding domain-containing protein [Natrinema pellirubrum]AGB30033.1 looped-hinge helix DNA binding domain, AbrB family [Natrinema pellirubrum DSM 15624]
MSSNTPSPEVVRVSQKGQATIPKALREKFGIETPGEVFVYEESDRIVIEPVPSPDELHGIHADARESGSITERMRKLRDADHRREEEQFERLRPESDE